MVVLAAAVLSKGGKPLVSRQYMDMTRIRIEGLLAAFPKLVGSGKQHTYVETENVRYIYQPLEGLYLVLITNKQSNILEDLETLRLLSKLVPEYCQSLEEEMVCLNAFELIFAFDEVISLGHKENITVQQVRQNCEMESHEEKLHKMIIQSKINDTKDVMKKKALEIDKSKMDTKRGPMVGFGSGGAAKPGMGGGGYGGDLDSGMHSMARVEPSLAPRTSIPPGGAGSAPLGAGRGPSKGMQLGKAGKKANLLIESLVKEGEAVELEAPALPARGGAGPAAPALPTDPVTLNIDEKLSVQLDKQGGLENLEVQGTMSLVVLSEADAYLRVAISGGASKSFQFKTHPNIDKAAYSGQNVLGLKDPARPFPTGSELGILKWRMQSRDEGLVPISINAWPSLSGGQSFVNIEYESTADFDLRNVCIAIPLPHGPPTVNQCDGDWRFDGRQGVLVWTVDLVDDTNRSGSMEFVVPASDPDAFYPIEVSFNSARTFCDVAIESVTHSQSGAPVKYASKRQLATAEYVVA